MPYKLIDDSMDEALSKLKHFDVEKYDDKNLKVNLSKEPNYRFGQAYFERKMHLFFNRNEKYSSMTSDEVSSVKQARKHLDDAIAHINMTRGLNLVLKHSKPLVSDAIGYWEYNTVEVDGKYPKEIQVGISSGGVISVDTKSHHWEDGVGKVIDSKLLIEKALIKVIDSKF
jgi:hypothetical protein